MSEYDPDKIPCGVDDEGHEWMNSEKGLICCECGIPKEEPQAEETTSKFDLEAIKKRWAYCQEWATKDTQTKAFGEASKIIALLIDEVEQLNKQMRTGSCAYDGDMETICKSVQSWEQSFDVAVKERERLKTEVNQQAAVLKSIRAMAVVDWDDTVVGMADRVIKTYAHKVKSIQEELQELRDENERLKEI